MLAAWAFSKPRDRPTKGIITTAGTMIEHQCPTAYLDAVLYCIGDVCVCFKACTKSCARTQDFKYKF